MNGGSAAAGSPFLFLPPREDLMHTTTARLLFASVTTAALLACSSSSNTNPGLVGSNGVNDVNKACTIRASWPGSQSALCSQCKVYAEEPRCACADVDYAGACSAQHDKVVALPGCIDGQTCEGKCAQGDCACVDACYQASAACRTAASALDGCLAEICASHCQ
jgi:hypothetical protein